MQTVGMHDFEDDPTDPTETPDATVAEHGLPREWRDRHYRRVGSHRRFVCDVMALAFRDSWLGAIRPEDLELELTEVTGARQEKGINDIAWSASVPPEFPDGSAGGERVIVVIEVQWTVQWAMPFRVMQYEAMRARQMVQGQEPVSRIKTIVLPTCGDAVVCAPGCREVVRQRVGGYAAAGAARLGGSAAAGGGAGNEEFGRAPRSLLQKCRPRCRESILDVSGR